MLFWATFAVVFVLSGLFLIRIALDDNEQIKGYPTIFFAAVAVALVAALIVNGIASLFA